MRDKLKLAKNKKMTDIQYLKLIVFMNTIAILLLGLKGIKWKILNKQKIKRQG